MYIVKINLSNLSLTTCSCLESTIELHVTIAYIIRLLKENKSFVISILQPLIGRPGRRGCKADPPTRVALVADAQACCRCCY